MHENVIKNLLESKELDRLEPLRQEARIGRDALAAGDLAGFGKLMFASHESSIRYFENSCAELDGIVEIAKKTDGVLGARLSGGGFGGSVVALVYSDKAEAAGKAIAEAYTARYGIRCDVRAIVCSEGARLV